MTRSDLPGNVTRIYGSVVKAAALGLAAMAATSALAETRYVEAPHNYWTRALQDPFTGFLRERAATLPSGDEKTFVRELLRALKVPESSQLLVFSATSLQRLVSPRRPRALYFNDEISVGWVPDGRVEVLSVDPELGPVFYIMTPPASGQSLVPERQERCLNCHAGLKAGRRPGFVLESVIINDQGGTLESHRSDQIGHALPLADRFGGWHLTGGLVAAAPFANRLGRFIDGTVQTRDNPPGHLFKLERYLRPTSDGLAHLVHEHQAGFVNRVTAAAYRAREMQAASEGGPAAPDAAELETLAQELVRYVLFADEAPLPAGGISGDPEFIAEFSAARRAAAGALSLRDFDLKSRLFKHRCSYMIYTPQWAALPAPLKKAAYAQLAVALRPGETGQWAYLPATEKQAIAAILKETLPDLPAGWTAE